MAKPLRKPPPPEPVALMGLTAILFRSGECRYMPQCLMRYVDYRNVSAGISEQPDGTLFDIFLALSSDAGIIECQRLYEFVGSYILPDFGNPAVCALFEALVEDFRTLKFESHIIDHPTEGMKYYATAR